MPSTNVTAGEEEEPVYFDFSSAFYFCFYLPLLIPALFCSIFVLGYILAHRAMLHALYNHIITVIVFFALIYQITTFPWMLHYYRLDGTWKISSLFCRVWGFLDWSFYTVNTMLCAWSTIERYLLVFHDRWISTRNRRLCCHYLPMIGLIVYTFTFYATAYFFPPCGYFVLVSTTLCMSTCLRDDPQFIHFETVFNQLMPVMLILVFATLLVLRTLWQKYRAGQAIHWRRHRKMIIQSVSVSALYLTSVFPLAIVQLLLMSGFETPTVRLWKVVFELLSYLPALFLPIVIGLSLTEVRLKFFELICRQRQRQIVPVLSTRPVARAP